MNKDHLYDLAYAFRKSKVWEQIAEEEIFAVKLPHSSKRKSEIGYCYIMGKNDPNVALVVYLGQKGFSSFREMADMLMNNESFGIMESLVQNCIHLSFEPKNEIFDEDLDEIKKYCNKTGRQYRAPFPQFSRYQSYCLPWRITDDGDWDAIETALSVVVKMAEVLKKSGKKALNLHRVVVGLDCQTDFYPQGESSDENGKIPLYSMVDGKLVTEMIYLPPYKSKRALRPTRANDTAIATMKRKKQSGVYECEVFRLPELVDGEPPYYPFALIAVDGDGNMLPPTFSSGPVYSPDEMLSGLMAGLGESFPKAIKVRTKETRLLFDEFCEKAEIIMVLSKDLNHLDKVLKDIDSWIYDEERDHDDDIEEDIAMFSQMTVPQIREFPEYVLDQVLDHEELFPTDIVEKVKRAKDTKKRK